MTTPPQAMNELVERLRELLAKATPGLVNGKASVERLTEVLKKGTGWTKDTFNPEGDAALIVEAINALPTLLYQSTGVEELRSDNARLRSALDTIQAEASRPDVRLVHLKRCISAQTRQALQSLNRGEI